MRTHRIVTATAAAAAVLALVGCASDDTLDDYLGADDEVAEVDDAQDDDGEVEVEEAEPAPDPVVEAQAAYQAFLDAQVVAANGDVSLLEPLTTPQMAESLSAPPVDEDGELQVVLGGRVADPISVEVDDDDGTVHIVDCQMDRRRFVPLSDAGEEVPEEFRGRWTAAEAQLAPSEEGWQVVRYREVFGDVEAGDLLQPIECIPPSVEERLVEFVNDYYDARWDLYATGESDELEPMVTDQHYRWHQQQYDDYGAYNRVRGEGGSEVLSGNPNIARVRYCFDTTEYTDVDRDTGEVLLDRGEGWGGVDVIVLMWSDTNWQVDGGINVQDQGEECHDTRTRDLNTID